MRNLQKFGRLTPEKFFKEVPPSATSTFFGRHRRSIFADICRYVSKNVDICADFGRYLSKNVEKCRFPCRFRSIYVEKCRFLCRFTSIYVEKCRFLCRFRSIYVEKCRFLCRFLSIYVEKCRFLCRFRSIYVDICWYILNLGLIWSPKLYHLSLCYHFQAKQNEIIIFHALGVSLQMSYIAYYTIPEVVSTHIHLYQLDGQFCSIFGHFYPSEKSVCLSVRGRSLWGRFWTP